MKLQTKVFIGFSIALATIIAIGGIGYLGTSKVKKSFDKVIEETTAELNLLSKINLLSKELETQALDKFLISGIFGDSIQQNGNEFNATLSLLDSSISEIEKIQSKVNSLDKDFIDELKKSKQFFVTNCQNLIDYGKNIESNKNLFKLKSNLKKSQKSLSLLISIHSKIRSKEALIKNIGANETFNSTTTDIIITEIISIILLIILWIIYSRLVVKIKKAEIDNYNALIEKTALLQEVHHRVKNNLQVLISLTKLQIYTSKGKDAETVLKNMHDRISSMALVNQTIYENNSLVDIKYTEYITNLTNYLITEVWNLEKTPKITIQAKNIDLGIDTAAPLGLILNELTTNSLKYAFDNSIEDPEIKIELLQTGEKNYSLIFSDNGKGLDQDINFKEAETLGLQLISILSDQINGTISIDRSNGTKYTIAFEEIEAPELN